MLRRRKPTPSGSTHLFNPAGFLLIVGVLILSACAPAAERSSAEDTTARAPGAPKRLVAAMMSDPPTISRENLAASGSIQGGDVLEALVNSGLSIPNDAGTLVPQLAEAVPTVENGQWQVFPDGRMQTSWKLRPGAAWHDGTPISVEDVRFSFALGQDAALPSFRDPDLGLVESISEPQPGIVTVTWKQPFITADALFSTTNGRLGTLRPKHLLEPAYIENKEGLPYLPYWTTDFVGSGPFRLREWAMGSHLVLAANESYALGRPKLDEIEVRFIPDPNVVIVNLLSGQVDYTFGRSLQMSEAMQIRDQWKQGRIAVTGGLVIALWVQFINPSPAVLQEVQFRRALYHAIDRQEMVDVLEYGAVPPADTFIPATDPMYPAVESNIVRYPFDPRRSVQMIESLGYARGADGVFRGGDQELLSLDVRTNTGHEDRVLAIADYFKKIGIDASSSVIPDSLRSDREYNSTYPGVRLWRASDDLRLLSRDAPTPENRFVGSNRPRYTNPALDTLIERYFSTIPFRERAGVLGQIVRHTTEQLPGMYMYFDPVPVLIGNRMKNVIPANGAGSDTFNAQEWDLT
jgi:peptide/nickel transport system substrate-binding protein